MNSKRSNFRIKSARPLAIVLALAMVCALFPTGYSRAGELDDAQDGASAVITTSDTAALANSDASEVSGKASAGSSDAEEAAQADSSQAPVDESDAQDPTPAPAQEDEGDTSTAPAEQNPNQGDNPDTPAEEIVWNAGWIGPDAQGAWRYGLAGGAFATNQWLEVNGNWYWFDANGVMATGWADINGARYWLTTSGPVEGALAGGWVKTDDGWYYLHNEHDGHFGELQTGWLNLNGTWYWLDTTTGRAAEDEEIAVGENHYAFDASCAMGHDGWCLAGGKRYWAGASGALETGWKLSKGVRYYLDPTTYATVTGLTSIGDHDYYFSADGALVTSAWVRLENNAAGWAASDGAIYPADATISEDGTVVFATHRGESVTLGDATFFVQEDGTLLKGWDAAHKHYADPVTGKQQSAWFSENGTWYYLKEDGNLATGWLNLNGTWYWLEPSGAMDTGWVAINGSWYYFDASGAMQTGWLNLNGTWYWLEASGAMDTGWVAINGAWYYFDASGAMQTGWLDLGGTWYWLDASGAMATGTRVINGYTRYFRADGVCTSAGYQNPYPYYAVNGQAVRPRVSYGIFSYVSPLGIGYAPTRSQCVNAFLATAYSYIGTPYVWDYACAPGVGVDCAGLVLQCMYSVGMNPSRYSPYDHFNTYGHNHYANDMRNDPYIRKIPVGWRQPGDLLFWPGHVAIYIGGNQVIEAGHGHVTIGYPDYSIGSAIACGRLFN